MAKLGTFVVSPSEESLEKCTKEQLLRLAEHYPFLVTDKCLKEPIKVSEIKVVGDGSY